MNNIFNKIKSWFKKDPVIAPPKLKPIVIKPVPIVNQKKDFKGVVVKTYPDTKTPWVNFARELLGQREIVGSGDNPTIVKMFEYTTLGKQPDEVPWCAAFVNFCLFRTGYIGTRKATARSFCTLEKLPEFKEGCIVVIPRGSNPAYGHVGFCLARTSLGPVDKLTILGGNQGNTVSIKSYYAKPLGFYWPKPF